MIPANQKKTEQTKRTVMPHFWITLNFILLRIFITWTKWFFQGVNSINYKNKLNVKNLHKNFEKQYLTWQQIIQKRSIFKGSFRTFRRQTIILLRCGNPPTAEGFENYPNDVCMSKESFAGSRLWMYNDHLRKAKRNPCETFYWRL